MRNHLTITSPKPSYYDLNNVAFSQLGLNMFSGFMGWAFTQ